MPSTRYIVLGSNNFWYGLCDNLKEVAEIKRQIRSEPYEFCDPESDYRPGPPLEIKVVKVANWEKTVYVRT